MNRDWFKLVVAITGPSVKYSFFLVSIDPDKKDEKSAGKLLGFLFPGRSKGQQIEKVSLYLATYLLPLCFGYEEKKPTQEEWQSRKMEQAWVPDTVPELLEQMRGHLPPGSLW